jgi:putative glutathione S-transferase
MLRLKGLTHIISHSVVHPTWGKTKPDDDGDKHHGWVYKNPGDDPVSNPLGHGSFPCDDALIPDTVTDCRTVREVFESCGDFDGPFTTPLLYDKKSKTIVSNESTDILRMLNFEFNEFAKFPDLNLYPSGEAGDALSELNDSTIYKKINNGVYKCGFAHGQGAYDEAVTELFEALDSLETGILAEKRYLGGDTFTWLDLRLFMTLVRFDPVYITYFKTNKKRLVDYPNLLGFVRDVYSMEAVKESINMDHIKTHYFTSHPVHNTFGIIPAYDGPDLDVPHGREGM